MAVVPEGPQDRSICIIAYGRDLQNSTGPPRLKNLGTTALWRNNLVNPFDVAILHSTCICKFVKCKNKVHNDCVTVLLV